MGSVALVHKKGNGLVLTQTKHHQNVQASQISQSHHSLGSVFQVTVHFELS
jgi:hypothetical protein